MAKVRHLKAVLSAEDRASAKVRGVGKSLDALGKIAAGVGAAAIGTALVGGIKSSVDAFLVQERAEQKLESAFRSLGTAAKSTARDAKEYASQLQAVTIFGDEATMSAQQVLVSLGRLSGKGLNRATRATLDLAAAMGIDLKAAALLVAKAAQGETSSLSRYGIILDKAIPQSKKFAATLKQIETNFGGMATEMRKTTGGALQAFTNQWGDLKENLGEVVASIAGFNAASKEADTWLGKLNKRLDEFNDRTKKEKWETLDHILSMMAAASPVADSLVNEGGRPTDVTRLGVQRTFSPNALFAAPTRPGRPGMPSIPTTAPMIPTTGGLTGGFGFGAANALVPQTIQLLPTTGELRSEIVPTFDGLYETMHDIALQADNTRTAIDRSGRKMRRAQAIAAHWRGTMRAIGATVAGQLSAGLAAAIVQGAKLRDIFRSILQTVIQIAIRALIFRAFGYGRGMRAGGIVGGRQALNARSGFFIGGHDTGRDSVPIIARPGEMILPREISQLLVNAATGGGGGAMQLQFAADMPGMVTALNNGVQTGQWRLRANEIVTTRIRR